WREEDRAFYEGMIHKFEAQNPGVTIDFQTFKPTDYATALSAAMQSGKGPDILQVRAYGALQPFARPEFLVPLSDKVPELKTFSPQWLEGASSRTDGKVYGVPFAVQTLVIFYNKKLLDRAGVQPPHTWDQFLAALKTLKDHGITPLANGGKEGWTLEVALGVLGPNFYGGSTFYDAVTHGQTTFKNTAFTQSLARFAEIRPYMPQGYMGVAYTDMQQLFINEQAAMYIGGIWELGYFQSQNSSLQIGIMPGPVARTNDTPWVSSYDDGNYGVNAKTPYMDAAIKFIRFTATRDWGQAFTDQLKQISAVPGIQVHDPTLRQAVGYMRHSTPYIMLVGFRWQNPTGSDLIQSDLQGLFAGSLTPDQVGADVTKGLSTWFAPFRGQ
ncbi:MAG TPA: extracellular solute-binding protein, partial [bacterium]|nr:extracellular solute-binding protein [bacterium]